MYLNLILSLISQERITSMPQPKSGAAQSLMAMARDPFACSFLIQSIK